MAVAPWRGSVVWVTLTGLSGGGIPRLGTRPAGGSPSAAIHAGAVSSGTLEVSRVTDGGLSGGMVNVPPGPYRDSVDYSKLGSVDVDEMAGDDRYEITNTTFDA